MASNSSRPEDFPSTLAKRLVEATPQRDRHSVTVGDPPNDAAFHVGVIEDDAFGLVSAPDAERAVHGDASAVEAWFVEQVEGYVAGIPEAATGPIPVSNRPSAAFRVDLDFAGSPAELSVVEE